MQKELGSKHTCGDCGTKFYDLGRHQPQCPKCGWNPGDFSHSAEVLLVAEENFDSLETPADDDTETYPMEIDQEVLASPEASDVESEFEDDTEVLTT